jgi:hypothetical protein
VFDFAKVQAIGPDDAAFPVNDAADFGGPVKFEFLHLPSLLKWCRRSRCV